jgi:ribonuclease P protein subunit POP4
MHGYNNRNIVIHELVGTDAEVVESTDRDQVGISGRVIKETKNLLYIRSGNGIKRIAKNISVFRFSADKQTFTVQGKAICFRSHERTEKALGLYKRRKTRS